MTPVQERALAMMREENPQAVNLLQRTYIDLLHIGVGSAHFEKLRQEFGVTPEVHEIIMTIAFEGMTITGKPN